LSVILEVRTYRLTPGSDAEFTRLFRDQALPLLADMGTRVVAFGLSLASDEGRRDAYLIRAFASMEDRERQENQFYGSRAWREGPREAILSVIQDYHTVVLEAPQDLSLPT
jgi:hypothetical protein